jgi:isopentenyl-diphosphate delta-isomerase
MGELFKDFGLPSRWILENLDPGRLGSTRIVCSGGIRDGIQAVKALCLGASHVAVARPFLLAAVESSESVVAKGRQLISEMQTAMFLAGRDRVSGLDRSLLMNSEKNGN